MSIDPELILAQALQMQAIPVSAPRAAEIALEVECLITGLAGVLDTVGFFDEPDGYRAVLWELREAGVESDER